MIDAKRLPTDRYRGGAAFVETRTSAYYLKLGYLAGLGRSSPDIAEAMGDGIHPSTVRTMVRRSGFHPADVHCVVPLTSNERLMIAWRAGKRGMSTEAYLAAIARAVAEQDLFDAIVDTSSGATDSSALIGAVDYQP